MACDLSVLVPYRSDGGGRRDELWSFVRQRLEAFAARSPLSWEIVLGECDPTKDFNRGQAINDAARKSCGEAFMICDADSAMDLDWIHEAYGRAVVDDDFVLVDAFHYLTEVDTDKILLGPPDADIEIPAVIEWSGTTSWGGASMLPAYVFRSIAGFDDRFVGWGPEDAAFVIKLETLHKTHLRLPGKLVHLWHPAPPTTRPWGEGHAALLTRYTDAAGDIEAMRAVMQ